jgi:bifunctional UDP-N-acetylglucosamine pyrophosphorylase/glucosamine-1-phosphate N-acetyltransferase
MKSNLCKVLHKLAGFPMIWHVIRAIRPLDMDKIVVVLGRQAEDVKTALATQDLAYALQEPQLGTGHAAAAAKSHFERYDGEVLVLCGDIPLIQPSAINDFIEFHSAKQSRLTVMTTRPPRPQGYGRIVRGGSGQVLNITEEKDACDAEREITEVNTGIYLVESALLFSLLEGVGCTNAQGEYYLTDIVGEAVRRGIQVEGFLLNDWRQAAGINTRADLALVNAMLWNGVREDLMASGVTLLDPDAVYVDLGVEVGSDTIIYPSVTLEGRTRIGRGCLIEPGVFITDSVIGDRAKILMGSRLQSAVVGDGTTVGPMAHLRPDAVIGANARVGNFVEVKKSTVGDGSKAAHLTYLGDCRIGRDVNIGCGTITCNYDGKQKHPTIIGDRCFVGSDVQFIAPVEIGAGSVIGAGSTVTRSVPPRSLAVSRAKQKIYPLRRGQGPESADEDREA